MTAQGNKTARLFAIIMMVVGAVFVGVGATAYVVVGQQLAIQNITVADDAQCLSGASVDNPIAAWCQQDIINTHALHATDGKYYAQMDREDPLREVAMNGALLRTSLFTSIIAFGVSAFAAAMGAFMLLVGASVLSLAKGSPKVVEVAPLEEKVVA